MMRRKFLSLSVMVWTPQVWFGFLNTDVCKIDACAGAICPGFLYSQWREIDTCGVLCVSSHSRGGEIQPRSGCSSLLLNKITWRAMSDVDILATGTITENSPLHSDSAPLVWGPCSSSPAISCPLREQAGTQQKKDLRQGSWRKTCLQGVTQLEECSTGNSKWVGTSLSA